MELRTVDPRALKPNPNNPRRTAAAAGFDAQLAASIQAIGLTQPPVVRAQGDDLMIIAGHRRVAACITIDLAEIPVLVMDMADDHDTMRAFAENIIRTGLGTVDIWRSIEALAGNGWTEEGIATALSLPARTIRRLRLCGTIHPAILDQMAKGDEPNEHSLRLIAAAPREDQAQAWKKFKPKKGERTAWYEVARALSKRRMMAANAGFGEDLAKAYGIVWEEDLFAEGDTDNRYTTQVDAFLGAQHEWMQNNLPKNGIILALDKNDQPALPPKAERVYGKPGKGDFIGHHVDESTGKVETIAYRMPETKVKAVKGKAGAETAGASGADDVLVQALASTRPPITQKGMAMIGDFRTEALHQALAAVQVDDLTLIGMLVMALAGRNVEVRSGMTRGDDRWTTRTTIVGRITQGALLTKDPELLRGTAREMLAYTLSCRENMTDSGPVARIAGEAIGASAFLPTMATEEFLSCVSKAAIEAVGSANGVLPRQTGKATRAAVIDRFKSGHFVHHAALFGLDDDERRKYDQFIAERVAHNHHGAGTGPDDENADPMDGRPHDDAESGSSDEGDAEPDGDGNDGAAAAGHHPTESAILDQIAAE